MKINVKEDDVKAYVEIVMDDNDTYTCIRKADSAPSDMYDGRLLFEKSNQAYIDTNIRGGVEYFYALENCNSKQISIFGPFLVFPPHYNINLLSNAESIDLFFTCPRGCTSTKIFKMIDDEYTLLVELDPDMTSFSDSDVKPGVTYKYALMASYGQWDSKYIMVEHTFSESIKPPQIILSKIGKEFVVEYSGTDQLILSFCTDCLNLIGTRAQASDIDGHARFINYSSNGDGTYHFQLDEDGIGLIYPMVSNNGFYYIGDPQAISSYSKLKIDAKNYSGECSIRVSNIPPDCIGIKIICDSDRIPNTSNAKGNIFSDFISIEQLKKRRNLITFKTSCDACYIKVYTVFKDRNNNQIYVDGIDIRLEGRKPIIRYSIRSSLMKSVITFQCDDNILNVPGTKVICGRGVVPLDSSDGDNLMNIPPIHLSNGKGQYNMKIPKDKIAYCRLFFIDPNDEIKYSIFMN